MRVSNVAAIAALVLVLVLITVAWAPLFHTYTTGTSTGVPKRHSYKWSLADFGRLQRRYATAFGLSPRQLLRGMLLGIAPESASTPEQYDVARNALSTRAAKFVRWKESMHAPATALARKIDSRKPLVLFAFTSGLSQLTRLKERGKIMWAPEVIVLFGGYLGDEEWQRTRRAWSPARVEQFYGASECPLIATRDADGDYRPAFDTAVTTVVGDGKSGVWVWGHPAYDWTRLSDTIRMRADGRFHITNSRQRPYDDAVWRGLDAISRGDIDAFQVQKVGDARYRVAYVAEAAPTHTEVKDPAYVASLFEGSVPGSTFHAARGAGHFRPAFGSSIKRAGYVDLTPP